MSSLGSTWDQVEINFPVGQVRLSELFRRKIFVLILGLIFDTPLFTFFVRFWRHLKYWHRYHPLFDVSDYTPRQSNYSICPWDRRAFGKHCFKKTRANNLLTICWFISKTINTRLPVSNPISYVTIWKWECSSKTVFPDTILGISYVFQVIHIIPLFYSQTNSLCL
jgi:hypothetical protein